MIDPVTCVGLATSAFNAIKHGISVGRDLQDMSSQLSQWGQAMSDFNYAENKSKTPPWYTFKGSDQETALTIFAQRKKMEEMRKQIKDHISWTYGPAAWDEVMKIEADMRKRRKEELYRKQEQKEFIIELIVGLLAGASGIGIIAGAFWLIGRSQGIW